MSLIWHRTKGYAMAVTAFIACPCHLPITLPLLLALMAGTAVGSWLNENTTLIYVVATAYFVGGGVLAIRWLSAREPRTPTRKSGPAEVVLVVSSGCETCGQADRLWSGLRGERPFRYLKVDIRSGKGRSLVATHNIYSTPTTLIDGEVAFRGVPDPLRASRALGK